jgi:hypothetical protein
MWGPLNVLRLKGTLVWDFFGFKWFGQTNLFRLLINILKCFRFLFRIRRDIRIFVHSAYSHLRTDSFRVFGECAHIILNVRNWIIFITAFKGIFKKKSMYVCKWTEELRVQGIIDYLALAWQNNFFPRILIIRGMTFEYLGEFEFIFENNSGAWSVAQELAFDKKKTNVENLVQVYH